MVKIKQFGTVLGLSGSIVNGSVMHGPSTETELHEEDVRDIQALYGSREDWNAENTKSIPDDSSNGVAVVSTTNASVVAPTLHTLTAPEANSRTLMNPIVQNLLQPSQSNTSKIELNLDVVINVQKADAINATQHSNEKPIILCILSVCS